MRRRRWRGRRREDRSPPVRRRGAGGVVDPVALELGPVDASAFFCALAMVVVMFLAGDRRYVLFGTVACAGFPAVSALVQEPHRVTWSSRWTAPRPTSTSASTRLPELRSTRPACSARNLKPLGLYAVPAPRQAYAEVFIDDQDQKVQAQLSHARYALTAPGTTVAFLPQTESRDTTTEGTVPDTPWSLERPDSW
jgi:hypothetical protein